jgi:hypothetical protein
MRYRIVLCVLLAAAIAVSAGAQTQVKPTLTAPATQQANQPSTQPSDKAKTDSQLLPVGSYFSFSFVPGATIPLLTDAAFFNVGAGADLSLAMAMPFFPAMFLSLDAGYTFAPLRRLTSISLASGGLGLGFNWEMIPNLVLKAYGSGGYFYAFLNDGSFASGMNFLATGGLGISYMLLPNLSLGIEGTYRNFFGLYNDVQVSLGTTFYFGSPAGRAATQRYGSAGKPGQLIQQSAPKPGTGLELSKIDVSDIYPVFYKFYDDHPIGSAVLHNWERAKAQNVKVSVWVKEYMSNPKEAKVADSLDPGAEASIDLYGLFKKDVLGNTEDTKVSANITVQYTMNGTPVTNDYVQTVKILKRNSLTWDDDRKAAAFVSPNDPTAVKFAKNVVSAVNGKGNTAIEPNLRIAAALHDALTLYGLTYSTDPVATLNSDNKTIDYIQFPQQTLDYRSGKCSDFSALYATMFEAVGLETAFITIPGHIYMAVALSLSPAEARATFTHKDDLIIKDDKVWLPIEITLREGGFVKAWQLGAKEWRENLAKNQAVLYPVREAWKLYEPVGYSSTTTDVNIPADDKIVKAFTADIDAFVKGEMGQQELALQTAVNKAATQANKSKAINSLAVLHSRFGLLAQAEKEFLQVLAKEEYLPSLINLGNIYYMQGNNEKALEFYNRGAKKAPKNATVLLCVARANHALENYSLAKKAYADLQVADPELAQRFAYLDLRGEEATRAADQSQVKGVVIWQDQ